MHAWRFIRKTPLAAVQATLRREQNNLSDLSDGEDDLRMKMLIAACYQGERGGIFTCPGVSLEIAPYKDVYVDLEYDVKQWNDEVETWAACQKYGLDAEQIDAFDLLLERLRDMVDAGEKLPARLVDPAAILLNCASRTL